MENPHSSSREIWAKPDETLDQHVTECLRRLKTFLATLPADAVGDLNVGREELESRLFAAVYLHDIGKASHDFQAIMKAKREGRPLPARGFPHALLSIPFGLACAPPIDGCPHEALAVGSHHTPYYDGLYADWSATDARRVREAYLWDEAMKYYRKLPETHEQCLGRPYPFQLRDPTMRDVAEWLATFRDALLDYPGAELRRTHATFLSALHVSDWPSVQGD